MTEKLTVYKIFFASPGGLEIEREAFKKVIEKYNDSDARHRGVLFEPVMWEKTLRGVGRPNQFALDDLKKCHYFVMALGSRWGTTPHLDGEGTDTSGTEEEYKTALERFNDQDRPMKQMILLYKAVSPEQLADPGPQLSKVLEFKRRVEEEKIISPHTYSEIDEFCDLLRDFLHKWMRAHEYEERSKVAPARANLRPSSTDSLSEMIPGPQQTPGWATTDTTAIVDEAWILADEGKLVDAEVAFSKAIVQGNDPYALNNYGMWLVRQGRLSQAEVMFKRIAEMATATGDKKWEAASLGNRAVMLKHRGDLDGAMKLHGEEERILRELGNSEGLQKSLGNQALVLQARGDLDGAMKLHKEKEQICRELGNLASLSISLCNQAVILQNRGDLDGAMTLLKEQERICRDLCDQAGLSACLGNQALILQARGSLDGAMKLHKEEERICRDLGYQDGLSACLGNQATILKARGDLDGAMGLHKEEERICRNLGDQHGLSCCLGNQALILQARGDLGGAIELHKEQERICRELGIPAGLQASLGNQAVVLQDRGDLDGAMKLHKEKERICRELGDPGGLATSLINQALVLKKQNNYSEARELAEEAHALAVKHGLADLTQKIILIQIGLD